LICFVLHLQKKKTNEKLNNLVQNYAYFFCSLLCIYERDRER